jgi:hypothetical protein
MGAGEQWRVVSSSISATRNWKPQRRCDRFVTPVCGTTTVSNQGTNANRLWSPCNRIPSNRTKRPYFPSRGAHWQWALTLHSPPPENMHVEPDTR